MHYTNKTQCILPANAKRISASHGCFHSKYFADYCKLFVASKFASHSRKYLTGPNTQNINLLAMWQTKVAFVKHNTVTNRHKCENTTTGELAGGGLGRGGVSQTGWVVFRDMQYLLSNGKTLITNWITGEGSLLLVGGEGEEFPQQAW